MNRARFLVVLISLISLASHVAGQSQTRTWTSSDGNVSVVAERSTSVSDEWIDSLLAVAIRNRNLSGVPTPVLDGLTVRISLAAGLSDGVEGRAYPSIRVLALPMPDAQGWSGDHLVRVYRHELAHIALGHLLAGRVIPYWLREGFPEWVEGGFTCEQEAQLRLDVVGRIRQGVPLPGLDGSVEQTSLSYAYYATVLQYVDDATTGGVSSGAWLAGVAENGLDMMLPPSRLDFEHDWHAYLMANYGKEPVHRHLLCLR